MTQTADGPIFSIRAWYPEGTARRLLATDLVTPQTRAVLEVRLNAPRETIPEILNDAELATLHAASCRLVPRDERTASIGLASAVDLRLAQGENKGWRYDEMLPDAEMYRRGLQGMEECARIMFGSPFTELEHGDQEEVLRAVQRGDAAGEAWKDLPAKRFFEEMLAELVEIYYSHPLAYDEIGYAGYADAHGWQAIGLNQLALHEPRPAQIAPQAP